MYLNKVLLIGNLTRDPELKSLPSGTQVASFGLATNRVYMSKEKGRQEQTDFHNIVVFGRQAETTAQYLKKGNMALIEGRIQTRSWDAPDGTGKRYRTEIVADRVQFGPKGSSLPAQAGAGAGSGTPSAAPDEGSSGGGIEYPDEPEINPDDIPF
ncbi:single-stranded DNA-binding protein [Candidatus Wolfebacteria bacterium]|nr:single-stranded DNA-binding protein [Candidatus Wolfebacteria bacterium]